MVKKEKEYYFYESTVSLAIANVCKKNKHPKYFDKIVKDFSEFYGLSPECWDERSKN
jgi:hypothetical protein